MQNHSSVQPSIIDEGEQWGAESLNIQPPAHHVEPVGLPNYSQLNDTPSAIN